VGKVGELCGGHSAKRASDKEPERNCWRVLLFWITNGHEHRRRDISKIHREPDLPFLVCIICVIPTRSSNSKRAMEGFIRAMSDQALAIPGS
jgi:hypothetical protein